MILGLSWLEMCHHCHCRCWRCATIGEEGICVRKRGIRGVEDEEVYLKVERCYMSRQWRRKKKQSELALEEEEAKVLEKKVQP